MTSSEIEEIKQILAAYSESQQRLIFDYLRSKFPIHPLEKKLNTTAEIILEAISRGSDLTLRGIRGIIAEAVFEQEVVANLKTWRNITPKGEDNSYDFLITDGQSNVSIQVKMQRLEKGVPKTSKTGKFIVETQRTRTGTDKKTKQKTRPYRFGEFDILAVSLHPSTNNWKDFVYTVGDWLIPSPGHSHIIRTMQPVSKTSNSDWTNNLIQCIEWFHSKQGKSISP